jgi:hypothetical protein
LIGRVFFVHKKFNYYRRIDRQKVSYLLSKRKNKHKVRSFFYEKFAPGHKINKKQI